MTARPAVVVTRRLPEPVEREIQRDFDATLNPEDRPLGPDGLRRALQSADALLCTVTDRLTADVLGVEPRRARLLANFGVGFNHIDVDAAKQRGLAVSNTPDVLTDATADIAMTLLLGVMEARGKVLVKLNVAAEQLDAVIGVLPAMKTPTVNELYGGAGYAVETVVPKSQINVLIPALKDAGATDLIELTLSKIVH